MLDTAFDVATLARLIEAGGAQIFVEAGGSWRVPAEEIEVFLANPKAWQAERWGVSLASFLAWEETEGTPQCGGRLARGGRRCHRLLGHGLDPVAFEKVDGGLCEIHRAQAGRAEEARKHGL